ncbi:MAG: type II toxin-antitoxin system VapC family toxin [Thermoanaerobaculia bacterium]|nr:type II toxin-antitoxin system VapC family toxin [Thermoanaerobaculia bacterium]
MLLALDSSVLVSLFLKDPHNDLAEALLSAHAGPVLISPLNGLEFHNALGLRVHREELDPEQRNRIQRIFDHQAQTGRFVLKEAGPRVWERATRLAQDYTPRFSCRSLDVWHVAFALEVKAPAFWSFDQRQRRFAKAVGLKLNPLD